MSTEEKLNLP